MADLSQYGVVTAADRGADLDTIVAPNGAKLDIVITVLGFDSDVVQQAYRDFDRAEAKTPHEQREPDAMKRRQIAATSVAIKGWQNIQEGGKDVKFSAAKAAELMSNPDYVWLMQQVHEFGASRRHFFPKPPES